MICFRCKNRLEPSESEVDYCLVCKTCKDQIDLETVKLMKGLGFALNKWIDDVRSPKTPD